MIARKPLPSREQLSKLFEYDSNTGLIYRKVSKPNIRGERVIAGGLNARGYQRVQIDGVEYKSHRIVWVLFYDEPAPEFIDHINGDPSDNRIENLRRADAFINNRNTRKRSSKATSSYKGVRCNKKDRVWVASILVDGKNIHLGSFVDEVSAASAYQAKSDAFFCRAVSARSSTNKFSRKTRGAGLARLALRGSAAGPTPSERDLNRRLCTKRGQDASGQSQTQVSGSAARRPRLQLQDA